jgi:hypothetical protein
MAPAEFSNVDFFNLQSSITKLDRALDDANSQKTVRKGARMSSEHKPLEELQANVEEDLGKVMNSPLRPAKGSGYGSLPLEAVRPARRLHELLSSIVGPKGDPFTLYEGDTATELMLCLQTFVAHIDPDHPFLKTQLGFGGDDNAGGVGDDENQQVAVDVQPTAKGKGKQVADDEQPSKKGKGKKAVGATRGMSDGRIEDFCDFLANKLLTSTCSGGSSRRVSSKRTYPYITCSSCGRPAGPLRRVGRRPTHPRRRRRR